MRCSEGLARIAAGLLALAFGLAACQPVPQPFAHDRDSGNHVIAPPTEIGGVAVLRVFGVPDETAQALADAMAEALGSHEIPAARGIGNSRSKYVQGFVTARPAGRGKVAVEITWDLFDRGGKLLGSKRLGQALPVEDWRAGGRAAMRALTDGAAAEIAALLHRKAAGSATAAIPLHVWPVAGAQAGNDAVLRHAMESALRRRDFAIVPGLEGARLVVAGELTLGPEKENRRPIEVTWSVLDTHGHELGKLTQRNAVPAEALGSGWTALAAVIAENAAGGVSDLVRRLPPAAVQGPRAEAGPGL